MPARNLAHDIENAIRETRDQRSFIQRLLIDALGWEIDERATEIEDIAFDWSTTDLRAEGLDEKIADGTIRQLRPMGDNPWGIFIVEFKHPDVFTTGRGMTGPLRRILRGLVPCKRKQSHLASFQREHLLFICTHRFEHYRFAYFKAPPKGTAAAPLAAFGWGPEGPQRTLCEFNLPELAWPHPRPSADEWITAWSRAFDVEKVTKRFYQDYAEVFAAVEQAVGQANKLRGDELRLFTQTLFNRLMFLRFIERKGWLELNGRHDYLRALFSAPPLAGKSFYAGRLRPLFFNGLAIEGEQESDAIGRVPFLNGGLFEAAELDAKVKDIPDAAFASIVGSTGLFYRYNFTVEESTPLDIEVAVDPEMLGKVFEELVTGRHESGSYYTPRPVVSFMCREGLKGILAERTKTPQAAIAKLIDDHEVKGINETQAREILKSLDDLKAVDPACGSGAYLLGLLHEMIAVYRLLYSERVTRDARSLYELKLRIISQNLYGVDSDRFATNIAMLRLWLSLAVEADEPEPLPNLDFKIETGDSLLGPDPGEMPDLLRGLLEAQAKSLMNAKSQYLRSHGDEKEEYRRCIRAGEARLQSELTQHHGAGIVDWRIQFAEVFAFAPRGFDLVLANPPYVRQELIEKASKQRLVSLYAGSCTGKSDLYCFFYHRGLDLLRKGGIEIFICSNSWLDVGYGAALQRFLLANAQIISLHESAVERQFATADINTVISIVRKGKPAPEAATRFVSLRGPFQQAIADPGLRNEVSRTARALCESGAGGRGPEAEYVGDKWGAKYLRAPEIFNTIMEKGASRLRRLSEFFRGERYLNTGGADGFFILTDVERVSDEICCVKNKSLADRGSAFAGEIEAKYLLPLIKDQMKRDKRIEISSYDAYCLVVTGEPSSRVQRYLRWGEEQGYNQRSVTKNQQPWYKPTNQMKGGAPILVPRSFNDSFALHFNPKLWLSLRFYRLHPLQPAQVSLVAFLNSTLCALFFEVLGNKSLGQGALDFFMADFLDMEIPVIDYDHTVTAFQQLKTRRIGSVFEECGLPRGTGISRSRLNVLPDRRAMDQSIFDAIGLTGAEKDEVYLALLRLVNARLAKARSNPKAS